MHIWVLLVVIGAMCAQKIHSAAVLNFFTALWADSPVEQNMEAIDDPTNFTQQRSSVEAVSSLFPLSSVERLSLGLFSERVKKFIEQEKTEIEKTASVISTRKEPWEKKVCARMFWFQNKND